VKKRPEKLVERDIMAWAFQRGWLLHVIDSKKQRNAKGDFVFSDAAPTGISDLVGCDKRGQAVYIELKAPGKESVCRLEQRNFLLRVIEHNAFACVVSSPEQLEEIYCTWVGHENGRKYLTSKIPTKVLFNGKILNVD
jgi:hypothetical protein